MKKGYTSVEKVKITIPALFCLRNQYFKAREFVKTHHACARGEGICFVHVNRMNVFIMEKTQILGVSVQFGESKITTFI
jgi:hypothetical protein